MPGGLGQLCPRILGRGVASDSLHRRGLGQPLDHQWLDPVLLGPLSARCPQRPQKQCRPAPIPWRTGPSVLESQSYHFPDLTLGTGTQAGSRTPPSRSREGRTRWEAQHLAEHLLAGAQQVLAPFGNRRAGQRNRIIVWKRICL